MIIDMLLETISFNDAYESFYHGFLAGILSGMKGYVVKANREGRSRRSDLFIRPLTRRKPAYVLELEDDGYETVYRYGIAFCGKDCLVRLAGKE